MQPGNKIPRRDAVRKQKTEGRCGVGELVQCARRCGYAAGVCEQRAGKLAAGDDEVDEFGAANFEVGPAAGESQH